MVSKGICALLALFLSAQPVLAAVSCSVLTQGQDAVNATNFTTASVTPGANNLVLLMTAQSRNTATACATNDISSVTGNSLTWVAVNKQCFSDAGAPTQTVEIWRTMGASPSTGTINFDVSASTQINAAWAVVECSGVDTSGTNGSGAVVQSAINLVEPGTSLTVTLGAFGSSNNATLGAFGISDNIAITPGTGFTEIAEQLVSDGGNDLGLQVQWRSDNDTSVDASWSSIDAGGVAIEIKAAAAADTSGDVLWFH